MRKYFYSNHNLCPVINIPILRKVIVIFRVIDRMKKKDNNLKIIREIEKFVDLQEISHSNQKLKNIISIDLNKFNYLN